MNDYFLSHAIETANIQLVKAGLDPEKFQKQEIINLAMQLSIINKIDTMSEDIRDVESELVKFQVSLFKKI
jgi:hypothetical protein